MLEHDFAESVGRHNGRPFGTWMRATTPDVRRLLAKRGDMDVRTPSTQAPEPAVTDSKSALGAIGKRARAANLTRAYEIQATLLSAASGHQVSPDGREAAVRAAHQIAGSAGTFGMSRASRMAQDLQMHLERTSLAERHALMPVFAALDSLLQELTPDPESEAADAPEHTFERPTMLIAHSDPALATRISIAARARNWDTRWAGDVASVSSELAAAAPDVVLLDLDLDTGDGEGEAVLSTVARHEPPIPTIVLVGDDDFLDRVEASRAGATSFVNAGLAPEHIVAAVACTVTRRDMRRGKLLAVDDDPLLLDYLAELFKDSELDITTVSNPLQFWDKLRETQPDLVLLDVDMPGVTGLELCRLIRADAHWAQLPVLVLTGTVHPSNVTSLFAAGADDYVAKPVVGPELVSRINNRLDRVRLHRRMAETDHLTGLRNRSAFEAAFEELAVRAPQVDQPVTVASIDIDDFRRINISHGFAVGDEVIQRLGALLEASFHGEDIVGRWSGKEFVVAMLGLNRDDGVARIASILEAFRLETFGTDGALPIRATFSATVAEHGTDGGDLYELQRALGQTMGATKHVGGDRVLPVGWDPETDPNVTDVLLVEDDESLTDVLQHALTTRGLRGRSVGDGKEALRQLTGPDRLMARVIVLDVDLPGLNGLDVLARLGSEGVLNRSRVIMLTAHAGEAETLAALRLGAFDHVAKPFSLPVLVQRIRRALAGA